MRVGLMFRYYNDIWVYEIDKLEWRSVGKKDVSGPSPRGGCSCLTCQSPACRNFMLAVCLPHIEHSCTRGKARDLAASDREAYIGRRLSAH